MNRNRAPLRRSAALSLFATLAVAGSLAFSAQAAAGRIFKLQAVAYDAKNLFRSSQELTIAVTETLILNAPPMPPPHLDQAAPVLVN